MVISLTIVSRASVRFILNVTLETAQTLAPERFVVPKPLADRTQGPRIQFANTRRPVLPGSDQTHGSQQAKVLRNCRPACAKIRRDRADGVGTPAQQAQNLATRGVGNCPKHRCALRAFACDHLA